MTTTFDIAQDATATFSAYPWVLSDKGDGGGASETVVESDLDVKNGALWANNVCKALRQTNEVFQGTRFADKLGIGVVAGAAALRTMGGDVVLDTSDLYVSAGDLYVGSQAIVGSTGMAFAGNALNVAGLSGRVLAYSVATDATLKESYWGVAHYTNAEEPLFGVQMVTTSTTNEVKVGGGAAIGNAATHINFYTAANTTTVTGTSRGQVTPAGVFDWTGEVQIGGAINHDGTTVGLFGVTPAVRPPAYTITNDVADRSFDADTVTTPELADVVATLIRDLITIGALQ